MSERPDNGTRLPADGIVNAIGDTPLVRLVRYPERADVSLWAKVEALNPGGSSKARPAERMIAAAIENGSIGPDTTVIESTSGNLGVGLAQSCAARDIRLICVVDSRADRLKLQKMEALGAEIREVTEPDPQTGDLLTARLALVDRLVAEIPDSYRPDQYSNAHSVAAHAEGTMREIDDALGGEVDVLLVATSTTGTLRGCCDLLAARGRTTEVIAVDAQGSVLFGGERGTRHLPGHGAGVQTELSRAAWFDRLVRITDLDCVVGCRRLAAREGILAGASSGGVLSAFDAVSSSLDPGARCAAILADGGEGYLDTVFDDDWVASTLGTSPPDLARLAGDRRAPLAHHED